MAIKANVAPHVMLWVAWNVFVLYQPCSYAFQTYAIVMKPCTQQRITVNSEFKCSHFLVLMAALVPADLLLSFNLIWVDPIAARHAIKNAISFSSRVIGPERGNDIGAEPISQAGFAVAWRGENVIACPVEFGGEIGPFVQEHFAGPNSLFVTVASGAVWLGFLERLKCLAIIGRLDGWRRLNGGVAFAERNRLRKYSYSSGISRFSGISTRSNTIIYINSIVLDAVG